FPNGGQPKRVSIDGGEMPRWRADGRELFYVRPDGWLMSAPLAMAGGELQVGAVTPLFEARMAHGNTNGTYWHQYAVAADGQRFLVNRLVDEPSLPITIVMNWA